MTQTYLLRMEGVNLDNFVYDTNDLSTIRGGSWLLLAAPQRVKEYLQLHLKGGEDVEVITQGASWGLFQLQLEVAEAENTLRSIRHYLAEDDAFRYATFVVDMLPFPDPSQYQILRDSLHALNRYRQLQSPTVVFPEVENNVSGAGVCEFDFVSPAIQKEGEKLMGASVRARRETGRAKKSWYCEKCDISDPDGRDAFPNPAPDLSSIACSADGRYGQLDGKMAVIYLDGNGFGKKQREYCTSVERQKEFDRRLRVTLQDATLKNLLTEISQERDWLNRSGDSDFPGTLRLETLLWGGDEIIWVAPAWQGWWLLARFYQLAQSWRLNESLEETPLTLAGGLVFCSHKAPIHRVVQLAKNLGDEAKGDRTANRVALQVLEAFDHIGTDFTAFRSQYTPPGLAREQLVCNGEMMMGLLPFAGQIKSLLPKRQLHRLVAHLYNAQEQPAAELSAQLDALLDAPSREALTDCFGDSAARWLLLLEMWDYLREPKSKMDGKEVE